MSFFVLHTSRAEADIRHIINFAGIFSIKLIRIHVHRVNMNVIASVLVFFVNEK